MLSKLIIRAILLATVPAFLLVLPFSSVNADSVRKARQVPALSAGAAKKILVPINLALNKPATASGFQPGHDPAHAVDGDSETRWCAPDNGNGYWWQVDLQKPEEITACRIVWEQEGQPYQYRIEGSLDGHSWKTLVEEKGGGPRPGTDEHKFSAVGARYVRTTVTQAPPGAWASFWEFELSGKGMMEKPARLARDSRLAGVKAPPGFDVTLYAAPPDISYPTCIAATPNGEVFIGVDQNGSLDTQPNRGWVVRCLDTDGDGVADKFNIFAKMDSPRGIVFDQHVLYVMHPPVLEAFYDDNGDGVADRSEILVKGLAHDLKFRGADHTCNGVRLGIDGWLYIALGDYGALHAVGKDGAELQLHGGGIVRVRPDGSGLETVVQGTRNIYDVAIDPLMNIFTCDNTNDGDDWNVRLSHMIPTANYGYPALFRHFSDEMIQTMADYGGGSPTGALFLDEPGFPGGFGHGLYACQWGWNNVTRHPLKSDGASFSAEKETFIDVPRPTGIDADGEGNVYVASWKGATFNYAGPNAGYVVRVTPSNYKPAPFPDLQKAADDQLLQYLASPSAVWRLHVQREILRRGQKTVFTKGLEKLALANHNLGVRVAAIFTLNQLLGSAAHEVLLRIAQNESVRSFALRALADGKPEAANVPTKVFVDALQDRNPTVRLQAVIALNRLGRPEAADAILPLTAAVDASVAHVAFRALVSFHAADACFSALDHAKSELIPGAMRVLRNLHELSVVDGLLARLSSADMVSVRQPILEALCRLYYREADWDGSWWGTRPDTSGPYFKPVTWEGSAKISQALLDAASTADDTTLRFLIAKFQAHKIDLPGLTPTLIALAGKKPSLRAPVIELFAQQPEISREAIPFLEQVVLSTTENPAPRVRAFGGLERASGQPDALAAAVRILLSLSAEGSDKDISSQLREEFIHYGRHARNVASFEKMTTADAPAQRELAFAVLLSVSGDRNAPRQARNAARQNIEAAWKSPQVASLLRAVGDARASGYDDKVRAYVNDTHAEVAAAAAYALARITQNTPTQQDSARNHLIGKLPYEDVVREVSTTAGDPSLGAQLFERLACINCHTTSKSEPLKGPFLGDIAARYNQREIIESILRPNAQIAQGFVTTTVETKDGTEYEGFIVRESGDELEIRNLAGATVIAKKEIVKRGTRPTSIMPEGLADQLKPQELAALLAYLQSLKPKL